MLKLSEGLPPILNAKIMNSQRDSQTIQIGDFPSLQSAEIAAGMLRNHGIPCELLNATIASVLPMTDTWTPISLIVPANFAMKAKELLKEFND